MGDLWARRERVLLQRCLTTLRRVPAIVIPYRGDAKRRLPSSLRAALAVAMLGDVVEVAAQVGRVLVVTDDASVVPSGAEIVADPGAGLGAAVAAGLALVEAADGTTNALSLPDPRAFVPVYGQGSAQRFRAHGFATTRIPELELDVDSDGDLERIGARVGPRTRALLAVPA